MKRESSKNHVTHDNEEGIFQNNANAYPWQQIPHPMSPSPLLLSSSKTSLVNNHIHTPSIAFHLLPPNSARTGYTTEEALFISAQLSTDVVSVLQNVWVLAKLRKQHGGTQART